MAIGASADVVIVDLKDQVSGSARQEARLLAERWLRVHRQQIVEQKNVGRWVRIHSLGTQVWRDDLAAVMSGAPDGIVLSASAGPDAVRQLAAELYGLEQRHGIAPGSTRIMPVVGATPEAALTVQTYLEERHPRLAGLVWDAETLAATLGATRQRDAAGRWTDVFSLVRAHVLLVARVSGLMAIDTAYARLPDEEGLKAAAFAAHADGFTGMLALHPAQVPMIHAAFASGEEDGERHSGTAQLQPDRGSVDLSRVKRGRHANTR